MRRLALALPLIFATPLFVVAACFPDYAIGDGSDGGTNEGRDGTVAIDGQMPGSGDGGPGSGDGNPGTLPDGGATLDGAFPGARRIPKGRHDFREPSGSTQTEATLTRDFDMAEREVTVGEFRRWVTARRPAPCEVDAGTCTVDPGGPYEAKMVWETKWQPQLASDQFKDPDCRTAGSSFNQAPTYNGNDDDVPINCVNWYQAVAYCWFDGKKRLATQVEWQYEASGRGEGRTYPWGDQAPTDCTRAIWRNGATNDDNYNGCKFPKKVGSAPAGASLDGILDMGGSVREWVWDRYLNSYPKKWEPDYTGPAADAGGSGSRVLWGGGFTSTENEIRAMGLSVSYPENPQADIGIRCAKSAP